MDFGEEREWCDVRRCAGGEGVRARGGGCDWDCGVEVEGDWEGGGGVVGLMLVVVVGVDGGSMTSAMVERGVRRCAVGG